MNKNKSKNKSLYIVIVLVLAILLVIALIITRSIKGKMVDDNNIRVNNYININDEKASGESIQTKIVDNKNKIDKEKQLKERNDKTAANKGIEKLTSESAEQIIIKYLGYNNSKIECKYDHIDKRDRVDYYVIHAYENMEDHIATIGWYYVNVNTGDAYKWDIINDKLILLK